jgi:hypothetical protein
VGGKYSCFLWIGLLLFIVEALYSFYAETPISFNSCFHFLWRGKVLWYIEGVQFLFTYDSLLQCIQKGKGKTQRKREKLVNPNSKL